MNFADNIRPNLIDKQINIDPTPPFSYSESDLTISEKITNFFNSIYGTYLKENIYIILLIVLCIIFLLYRYYNKQEKFNPLYPPSVQKSSEGPVIYPADPLPIKLNQKTVLTRNIYPDPDDYEELNSPQYDYNNVYKYPNRSFQTGTYNTYQNAQDTDIINPLGFSNNFNTNTGNFVSDMTTYNKNNISDYQTILDNVNGNLNDALKIGPKHLNPNTPEYSMEPPYSETFE